jgi:hypothetical protein
VQAEEGVKVANCRLIVIAGPEPNSVVDGFKLANGVKVGLLDGVTVSDEPTLKLWLGEAVALD